MSDILTKFQEEMAELRKDWTEFYGQFIKNSEENVNGIYDADRQTEDIEDKED